MPTSIASFTPNRGRANFSSLVLPKFVPTTLATGSQTLSVATLLSGLLILPDGGAAPTFTLPTAAQINAALEGAEVGTSFEFIIRNQDAIDSITLAAGSGGTLVGTTTVATAITRRYLLVVTAVKSPADPASVDTYTVYNLGGAAN